jgi:hypothetical protein
MNPGTVALASLFVLGPGIALTFPMFPPGRLTLVSRIGLAAPIGYSALAFASFVCARGGLLVTPVLVLVWGALTVWPLAGLARRRPLREHLPAWRSELRGDRWGLTAGLLVVVAFSVPRFTYDPVLNLADQTPLRYWADGLEIADGGSIPSTSLQWGILVPSAQSKVALNSFHAAASMILGRGPLAPMGALLAVLSIGLLVLGFALARELGLRLTAPLVPILLFGNELLGPRNLTLDLLTLKAENWGRLVALAAVLLGVRAIRAERYRHRRREAVFTGLLLGVSAGTHLVATVVAGTFLLAYAGAWAILRRRTRTAGKVLGTAVWVGAVVGGVVLFAPPGEIGFEGVKGASAYEGSGGELGVGEPFDPTRYLALGDLEQGVPPAGFYDPPSDLYHEFVRRAVGEPALRRPVKWLFPAAFVGTGALLWIWGDRRSRALAVASVSLALAIFLVSLAFNYWFEVYVLAELGPRRLFDYTGVSVVLLAVGALDVVLRRLRQKLVHRPRVVPVAATALLVVFGALGVSRTVAPGGREAYLRSALEPLTWIEENLACRARVLADRRTLATFEVFTRHAGVLEGMGPYLRPDLLEVAVLELLDARTFFGAPSAGQGYLTANAVGAVVVTAYDQTLGGVGGPLRVGPIDRAALGRTPFLEVAARSETVTVYRVVGLTLPGAAFPDVRGLSGYGCDAGTTVQPATALRAAGRSRRPASAHPASAVSPMVSAPLRPDSPRPAVSATTPPRIRDPMPIAGANAMISAGRGPRGRIARDQPIPRSKNAAIVSSPSTRASVRSRGPDGMGGTATGAGGAGPTSAATLGATTASG